MKNNIINLLSFHKITNPLKCHIPTKLPLIINNPILPMITYQTIFNLMAKDKFILIKVLDNKTYPPNNSNGILGRPQFPPFHDVPTCQICNKKGHIVATCIHRSTTSQFSYDEVDPC